MLIWGLSFEGRLGLGEVASFGPAVEMVHADRYVWLQRHSGSVIWLAVLSVRGSLLPVHDTMGLSWWFCPAGAQGAVARSLWA